MRLLCTLAPMVLLTLSLAIPAQAQDDVNPERIFHDCKKQVHRKTEFGVNSIQTITNRCVHQIERLLEEGKVEKAQRLAHRCVKEIEVISFSCRRIIKVICHECIRKLKRLEAEELAERLAEICRHAVEVIRHAENHAKERIRNLF